MNLLFQFFKYGLCVIWWVYCLFFVEIIIAEYLVTIADYSTKWNFRLPELASSLFAAILMASHFIGGIVILIMGQIQLFTAKKYNKIHRIIGRIYIFFAMFTSICGMVYIVSHGTVGGLNMSFAFFIYGFLLFVSSSMTLYFAYNQTIGQHKEWALRTYILGVSSWFYRIFYTISALCGYTINTQNANDFYRPLDIFFIWGFYLIGLILMEIYIRIERYKKSLDHPEILIKYHPINPTSQTN